MTAQEIADAGDRLHEKCDEWFDAADTNKDGVLDFTEAKPVIEKWLLDEFGEEQGQDMVEAIFRFMDDNVDDVI